MTTLICKKGYITRRAYTRKNGTKVKAMCVKGNGKKKRSRKSRMRSKDKAKKASKAKGIPPLKKGELTKYGYHNVKKLGVRVRRKALTSAVKEYGASKVLKKLGVLRTYHKNKSPNLSIRYYDNMKWTRKKFNDQFKGDWTKSSFYKK